MDIKDPRPAAIAWEIIPLTPPHTTHTGSVAAKLFFVDNDGESLFFWAKLQILLLALLLGGLIYRWSKELFGFEAAFASLFLYGLDPNILAHSQIVHTDIAFTGLFFIGSYFFWRALEKLTWSRVSRLRRASSVWRQPRNTPILPCSQSGARWPLSVRSLLGPWNAPWVSLASSLAGVRKPCSCAASLFARCIAAYCLIWAAYGFRFSALPGDGRSLPMADELLDPAAIERSGFVADAVSSFSRGLDLWSALRLE